MVEYKKGHLQIISDFEIRTLMEEGPDIDLFIPTDFRTLNLYLEGIPNYMDNRIQLNEVRNIIIRFSTEEDNDYCTVHFLRNIDLQSAIMNFVFNYKNHYIKLKKKEYNAEMHIISSLIGARHQP
ncbi:hypothetical protein [Clostridium sp. Cult2]|uniref:hypothetical protein n=1 Tax=Clostridium sp. Cult2 TaxID=2079003 RepID=UPI001F1F6197|nr:hypothetical protein [Clostridium sp. Cult2]